MPQDDSIAKWREERRSRFPRFKKSVESGQGMNMEGDSATATTDERIPFITPEEPLDEGEEKYDPDLNKTIETSEKGEFYCVTIKVHLLNIYSIKK